MTVVEAVVLVVGGTFAGAVNAMAGGGSLITVPLLVLVGLPASVANGTNRIGVLAQNITSTWKYRREGFSGVGRALRVLVPVGAGSAIGALGVSRLADDTFELVFGLLMIPLLVIGLRRPRTADDGSVRGWPRGVSFGVFFAIGLYGGAFQAGVGLILLAALSHTGLDLVTANAVKVVVVLAVTAVAVPIFVAQGQVDWLPAALVAAGTSAGGVLGAHAAVHGGERVIRPVQTVAVLALAGRMVGLY